MEIDHEDREMVSALGEITDVTARCVNNFNGMYELRFLYEDGGWGNQKALRCEREAFIIKLLNRYIQEKRDEGGKK